MTDLHYDYGASKQFAESLSLIWLGDDFVRAADAEAYLLGFTQEQVNAAMRHHLFQVAWLFNPSTYKWRERIAIALWFLFGFGKREGKHG